MKKNGHWLFLAALLYIILPFDLVPDFVPCIGWGDDVASGIAGVGGLALRIAGGAPLASEELALVIVVVVIATIVGLLVLASMLAGSALMGR